MYTNDSKKYNLKNIDFKILLALKDIILKDIILKDILKGSTFKKILPQ